ncbi:MAG TPA: ATP synthase subunit I [Blastocatellia bacterium]
MRVGNSYLNLEPDAVNRRFWIYLVGAIAAGTALAAIFAKIEFAGGVLFGGVLATINYRWLMGSVRGILGAGSKSVPPGTAMMFLFRWLVIAALGFAGYRAGHLSPAAILTGLLAPAVAALIEAGYLSIRLIGRGTELNNAVEPQDNQGSPI